MGFYPNVFTLKHTATSDIAFRLASKDMWVREANIHCITNGALYGDAINQDASLDANDILVFQDFNMKDLFFKNATGGSNTTIYIVGIEMTEGRKKDLGIK